MFLKSFLSYFKDPFKRNLENVSLKLFYDNIKKMDIRTISFDDIVIENSMVIYDDYLAMFTGHNFYISMSPKINFLADCIAKVPHCSQYWSS